MTVFCGSVWERKMYMRCGVIDMGSNSIRLSVYDCLEAGENKPVEIVPVIQKKIMAGLAGYVKKGRMTGRGIEKACGALGELSAILDSFQPDRTGIFATASLRNVSNQDEVVNEIRRTTGILPEIISGQEEARLDFLGATRFYPMERGLLADIGGGSTELVWFVKNGPKEMISVPIGSLGLQLGGGAHPHREVAGKDAPGGQTGPRRDRLGGVAQGLRPRMRHRRLDADDPPAGPGASGP